MTVPLHQGKDAVGRSLPLLSRSSTSWRQTSLIPQEQITVRLDLGWSDAELLGMFAAEAYVPSTRELLALEVHPLCYYDGLEQWLGAAQRWQGAVVRDLFDPNPF